MHAADTNVLVRLIARDEERQVALAEQFVGAGTWISHVVLSELAIVLRYEYDFDAGSIADAMQMLLEHPSATTQDREVVEAALSTFRAHPRLGFPDCLILEVARKAGHLPLGTFDRYLGKFDGAQAL